MTDQQPLDSDEPTYSVPHAGGVNQPLDRNNRREIFGWIMYDWAHSAFTTTVVAALFGPYLTAMAQAAVGENGTVLSLGLFNITAKSFSSDMTALSVILQIFLLPTLGAIADYSHLKKRLMAFFCYLGALATCLLFFVTADLFALGGILFIIANLSFGAAVIFYNAFLNEITTEELRDKVSSQGYAYGYLGGGLLLAANLALVTIKPFGIDTGFAVRLSLLSAGLWWGGFALFTFRLLRARDPIRRMAPGKSYLTVGFSELRGTFRELRRLPHTFKYLVAYLFFNDGISTVIGVSAVFMSQELFTETQRLAGDDQTFLLSLILMIQFVAFVGALLFERIARWIGTKSAIAASLVIWSGTIIYSYQFLGVGDTTPALVMGAVIAIVLGGSQALSRSLFSKMIPHGHEASFFGIYEVAERGTAWMGPFIFARVVAQTGSYRQALLSLIVLFIVGLLILVFTDTNRAIREAGNHVPLSDSAPAIG